MIPNETKRQTPIGSYRNAPLTFTENVGQTRGDICYLSQKPGINIGFSSTEIQFILTKKTPDRQEWMALFLQFLGANEAVQIEGRRQDTGKVNYFIGNDPAKWHTDVPTKFVKMLLRMIRLNRMWKLTGDDLRKRIEKKQLSDSYEPSKQLQKSFNIRKEVINGHFYYVIQPLEHVGNKHILYLHGGGYVYTIMSLHWEFLSRLVDTLQCTITVPIYPLAPKYYYQDVFDMIVPIYQKIIFEVKPENVSVMGDSAGGGLSLALVQLLKEKNLPQPGNIILISPALDYSFSNPEIKAVEKYDPISAVPALFDIGKWYGRETSLTHYLISPIYGSFAGLGKISLFTGTHDITNPDSRRFKANLMK
ncbi:MULTISPECIES: alpha/beta hydrolase fold domain-containing protein [Paenibacillus]|uniref:alpha/beta hydrolase fold domain-containing protein n=1 Tax=Paenibacillus TaxID=44249 RepID=UPI0009F970AD|nr:alpha/beta hydrolase [Paenibacillus lautus]